MEYFKTELGTLYNDDSLELLKTFPDNSIDTIITDPPYGLEFMGKEWDKFKGNNIIDNNPQGAFGKKKGFKSMVRMPSQHKTLIVYQKWVEQWARELLRVAKPGATLLAFGGTRTFHRLACGLEDTGWVIKDTLMWLYGSGFPKATDISKQIDKKFGAERKIVGRKQYASSVGNNRNFGVGNVDEGDKKRELTEPATPKAKLWNGYKSHGLKPAYEPIIMAMKPNEGSYTENALKWGVAGLNIDAGRIPLQENKPIRTLKAQITGHDFYKQAGRYRDTIELKPRGRFPANILLDEEAAKMLDEQSGISKSGGSGNQYQRKLNYNASSYQFGGKGNIDIQPSQGGASRFFYIAKASKKERNMGLEGFESKLRIAKGRNKTGNKLVDSLHGYTQNPIKNTHPTVKPLKLMRYLIKLTSMPNPNQVYLDLFLGSGTTAMACELENKHWIGIEKEEEYCEIAEARISAVEVNSLFKNLKEAKDEK